MFSRLHSHVRGDHFGSIVDRQWRSTQPNRLASRTGFRKNDWKKELTNRIPKCRIDVCFPFPLHRVSSRCVRCQPWNFLEITKIINRRDYRIPWISWKDFSPFMKMVSTNIKNGALLIIGRRPDAGTENGELFVNLGARLFSHLGESHSSVIFRLVLPFPLWIPGTLRVEGFLCIPAGPSEAPRAKKSWS